MIGILKTWRERRSLHMQPARGIMHLYYLPLHLCKLIIIIGIFLMPLNRFFRKAAHAQVKCFAKGISMTCWMQIDSAISANDLSSE